MTTNVVSSHNAMYGASISAEHEGYVGVRRLCELAVKCVACVEGGGPEEEWRTWTLPTSALGGASTGFSMDHEHKE